MVLFIKSGRIVEIVAIMTPVHLFCSSRFIDKIQPFIEKHKHSIPTKHKQTLSKQAHKKSETTCCAKTQTNKEDTLYLTWCNNSAASSQLEFQPLPLSQSSHFQITFLYFDFTLSLQFCRPVFCLCLSKFVFVSSILSAAVKLTPGESLCHALKIHLCFSSKRSWRSATDWTSTVP